MRLLKLNLGCGYQHLDGYVNVDKWEAVKPDVLWDLEELPWPWETNSVERVVLSHILEHVGQTTDKFFAIIKELYRICADGAELDITLPHYQHYTFYADPTHIRPILPETLQTFSKRACDIKMANPDWTYTPFAYFLDVDFDLVSVTHYPDPDHNLTVEEHADKIRELAKTHHNIYVVTKVEMIVRK